MDRQFKHWHHAPGRLFVPGSAYIVTAGTYQREHLFDTPEKRDHLITILFDEATQWGWRLEAWAILSNHYHFVAHAPECAKSLSSMIQAIHSKPARWLNQHDGTPGRRVWFQFRDTCLTNQRSYLARVHYVHQNPVKHDIIGNAENYPWCSMAWFVQTADPGHIRTVLNQPIERVRVLDDF